MVYFVWSLCLLPTITAIIVNDNPKSHMVSGTSGAVAVENVQCSKVGLDVLKEGGNAVDSAIASALCIGVINSFATGIGGGGFMLIRTESGQYDSIDFRETAPAAATQDMYIQNATLAKHHGLAVSVPGEIRGFELAHKRHGKLAWARLFRDAIDIAKNGFVANQLMEKRLEMNKEWLMNSPEWVQVYAPNGTLAKVGDIIKRPTLAKTLELIATQGPDVFYQGSIAESIVDTVTKHGGIMTLKDMQDYQAMSRPVISTKYHQYDVFTTDAPSSGPVLLNILNIVEPYKFQQANTNNIHRLVEAFKFGFAARSEIGDPMFTDNRERVQEIISKEWANRMRSKVQDSKTFEPNYYMAKYKGNEPKGTMHLSVVGQDNSAVALTSTVNLVFGSHIMDKETGIILNNEQDDFSTPGQVNAFGLAPSPYNYIRPNKRPLSSITPVIIQDEQGELRMVVGGSGGSEIITATVNTIINKLDFNHDLFESVGFPRIHHQLIPNSIGLEPGFDTSIEQGLHNIGHNIHALGKNDIFSAVQSIYRHTNGTLNAVSDPRKFGLSAAY